MGRRKKPATDSAERCGPEKLELPGPHAGVVAGAEEACASPLRDCVQDSLVPRKPKSGARQP